jgi:hypothetical protein
MAGEPPKITHWEGPPLENWRAWTPAQAAKALEGLDAPWCVVGGWSIDLAIGRQSREHEDLEIAVPLDWFPDVRERLESLGLVLHDVGSGEVWRLEPGQDVSPERHQTWAADMAANAWRIDVMRESGDEQTWVYRRDPSLTAPRSQVTGRTAAGIPYLAPAAALFFKAKTPRPKDEADFETALPFLPDRARLWLVEALHRYHPGHAWIARLEARGG